VWIVKQLWSSKRLSDKLYWQLYSTQCLAILFFAELLTVLNFAIDPQGYYSIFPSVLNSLFGWFPIMLYLISVYLVILHWIEVQLAENVQHLTSVVQHRKLLLALMICTPIILVPLSLWQGISGIHTATLVIDSATALLLLFIIIFTLYYGIKLIRLLTGILNPEHNYVRKVTLWVLLLSILSLFTIIVIVTFAILHGTPWTYVINNLLVKVLEFAYAGSSLALLQQERESLKYTTGRSRENTLF